MVIYTFVLGTMADLMKKVEILYFRPGMRIADVTYGHGRFWRGMDMSKYEFFPSDLIPEYPHVKAYDCRSLPYPNESMDVVVLDPPFVTTAHGGFERSFKINTFALKNRQIIALYLSAMMEAKRVLRRGGLLLVKCQDKIASGQQRYTITIWLHATQVLGMIDEDKFCFVYHTPRSPAFAQNRQVHAIKRETYLWIFRKR